MISDNLLGCFGKLYAKKEPQHLTYYGFRAGGVPKRMAMQM